MWMVTYLAQLHPLICERTLALLENALAQLRCGTLAPIHSGKH